nr:DEAD/DEAH box helicase [Oligoflexales bacterium]
MTTLTQNSLKKSLKNIDSLALRQFHPRLSEWFSSEFQELSEVQDLAWPEIRAGKNVLISAPTGSGKTFSAFLVLIDQLIKKAFADELKQESTVLYLSPLKALSNDIEKNLLGPIQALEQLCKQDYPGIKPIQLALRTGDSSAYHKSSILKKPPHILVTTPESLYLLLGSLRGRALLSTIETVIVDEIHILAADKRGSHLALSLERLQNLCQKPLQRIGLSATQKPLEKIAQFLVGSAVDRPCHIINLSNKRNFDLGVVVPQNIPLSAVCSHEAWDDLLSQLAELIKQHRATLIFVNTRRLAERIAYLLRDYFPPDKIACHHGSLSKELRLQAENNLKAGALQALVATSSLELGIDIGSIDLVCQISSTRNIATFVQRVGRSGHMYKGKPKGRIFALTQEELVEATALIIAVQQGTLDNIEIPHMPRDILAQHLIAELALKCESRLELFKWVSRAAPYQNLRIEEFDKNLAMLVQGYGSEQRERALIQYDSLEDRFTHKGPARLVALMNGGAIPDHGDFPVILEQDNIKLGTVSEDFAIESSRGDIFVLGSHSWKITKITQGKVYVQDVGTAQPNIPVWFGEAPGRSLELSLEVAHLRSNIADKINLSDVKKELSNLNESFLELVTQIPNCYGAALQWLSQHLKLDQSAAIQLTHYIARQIAHLGIIPDEKNIVFERFFDASSGMQLVVHSPYGMRINRALGLAMRKRFCRSFDFELQAAADDNGFVLSLGPQHSFPIDALFGMLQPENLRSLLEQAILPLPMFATRWRWNCSRALAVARMNQGTRVPPALQRFRSEDLLTRVFPQQTGCQENLVGELPIPDHPLVLQTIEDCLSEAMDLKGACLVLESKRAGQVQFIAIESAEPSPFAQALINARPYAFLDGAPLEDRRTRVTPYRAQTVKISEKLTQIDPSLLADFAARVKPVPQNIDELHNLLLDLVMVRDDSLNLNPTWLQKLLSNKKIQTLTFDKGIYLYHIEYLKTLR